MLTVALQICEHVHGAAFRRPVTFFIAHTDCRTIVSGVSGSRSRARRAAAGSNRRASPARRAIFAVLPGRDGKAAGAVLVLSAKPTTLGLRRARHPAAGRHLAAGRRHRTGVADRRRRRHRARHLALRTLSDEQGQGRREDRLAAGRRQGARHGDDRGDLDGARPRQHAGRRHGALAPSRRGAKRSGVPMAPRSRSSSATSS